MGDFLTSLVAKNLDLGEVVQPRPLSLFEPFPLTGWPTTNGLSGMETPDDQHVFEHAALLEVSTPTQSPRELSPPTTGQEPPTGTWQPLAPENARPEKVTLAPPTQPDVVQPRSELSPKQEQSNQRSLPLPPASQTVEVSDPPATSRPKPPSLQDSAPRIRPRAEPIMAASEPLRSVADQPGPPPTVTGDGKGTGLLQPVADSGRQPALEPYIQRVVVERTTRLKPVPIAGSEVEPKGEKEIGPAFGPAARRAVVGQTISPPAPSRTRANGAETHRAAPATQDQRPGADESPRPLSSVVPTQVTPALCVEPRRAALLERATSSQAAPTVHVTIGRIEVRATPPPASAPKQQRPAPPVMSLDEYLRQRAGGESR